MEECIKLTGPMIHKLMKAMENESDEVIDLLGGSADEDDSDELAEQKSELRDELERIFGHISEDKINYDSDGKFRGVKYKLCYSRRDEPWD
jgi:hypothetical protein